MAINSVDRLSTARSCLRYGLCYIKHKIFQCLQFFTNDISDAIIKHEIENTSNRFALKLHNYFLEQELKFKDKTKRRKLPCVKEIKLNTGTLLWLLIPK